MIELSLAEAVERAASLAAGDRTILGIVGSPGAGKSTLSAAIVDEVPSSVVVPMDGFHLLNEQLVVLGRRNCKGAADTFDVAGYIDLLERIRHQGSGSTIHAPRYDRAASRPFTDAIEIDNRAELVITEGNYLLVDADPWSAVRPLLDEVWYIDVSDDVRVPRLIARHIAFGKSPDEAREWVLRSAETNAALVAATRSRADAVVHLS